MFAVDPTIHGTKTINMRGRSVDGRIEIREPDDGELRIRGFPDQPDGWQPFSLSQGTADGGAPPRAERTRQANS